MTVWTHPLLDRLRQIGDPELDDADEAGHEGWRSVSMAAARGEKDEDRMAADAGLLQAWRKRAIGAAPVDEAEYPGDAAPRIAADPFWTTEAAPIDPERLEVAHSLFVSYGSEIGATLLLASLPNAYAAEAGAAVLTTTTELRTNTRRRIGETAQFVVEVLFPDSTPIYTAKGVEAGVTNQALPPGSRGYVRVRTTRLTHAVIRSLITRSTVLHDGHEVPRWDPKEPARVWGRDETKRGVPINQEDLLGTLGTFTVTVFDVMEKLGVPWTEEAEQAYLDVWDRVGELLGIGTAAVTTKLKADGVKLPPAYVGALRPKTPTEARQLMALIRERNWPLAILGRELGPFSNPNGKVLVRALLDELQAAMPRGMERLPLFVMRYLVEEPAHEMLGLGGGGFADSLLRWPRQPQLTRVPGRSLGMGAVHASMRLAANDISRRAFVHFMRERAKDETQSDFWFPVVPPGGVDMRSHDS